MMRRMFKNMVGLSVFVLLLSACGMLRGSGEVVTVMREVSDFDHVTLSGVGTLHITVGDKESLQIEAEDNLLPYIETRVHGKSLDIGFGSEHWTMAIQPTQPIHYYLTVTHLEGVELSGSGNIEINELETPELRVVTSGAGNIEISSLITKRFTADVSGAGSCRIFQGEVQNQELHISGAGGYRAADLKSQTTNIDISGIGGAEIWVEDTLNVAISGAGSVSYYGQPSVSQDVSGVGNISSLGIKN